MHQPSHTEVASARTSWTAVEDFFFAPEKPYAVALLRITLPWILMIGVLPRWFHVRELFSLDGAPAPLWQAYGHAHWPLLFSPAVAVALYTLLIFALITASLGWLTRSSLLIAMVLYPYFGMADSLSTLTKYSVISTHIFLLLACSRCGDIWSVDAWLQGKTAADVPSAPAWPRRLLQILVAVIYLGAAATKLHAPEYFTGDLMRFWMLTNTNFPNPVGEALSIYPVLIVVMSYISLLWEVVFIFTCWKAPMRNLVLGIGLIFHLMTFLLLGLIIFPMVFVALYVTFLTEQESQRLGERLLAGWHWLIRHVEHRSSTRSRLMFHPACYWVLCAVLCLGGVTAEARLDVYQEQRPEGRHVLQPMSPEREKELFNRRHQVRLVDKVFAFDLGTTLVGGQLADHKTVFQHGEQVIGHCVLTPPHEDLWLEINLHDADNHPVDRFGCVVPREELRVNAYYNLTESLEPGRYALVLKLHGQEVMRRHFELR